MKEGILLINLGTPEDSDVNSVKRYLGEFLMDPFVIDIPLPLRFLLVKGIILRTRPRQSAHAYQQIWTEKGSPLRYLSQALADATQSALPLQHIELGMRYGNPSIEQAVSRLKSCDRIIVLPVFPQYSLAATESAIVAAKKAFKQANFKGDITVIESFFQHPAFIKAQSEIIQSELIKDHHLLLSYHGLPEKHLNKVADCKSTCSRLDPCPSIQANNQRCYRAQCYASSKAIADKLSLSDKQYSVSFQSRLGKLPWIKPYTDLHFDTLRQAGITKLAIACPSFFVDCLETLEEIGLRAKEQWLELGGESFQLIPCLNNSKAAVNCLTALIQDHSKA